MGVYEDLLRRKKIIEDEQGNVISNNVVNKDIRNQLNDNNIQTYNTEETRNSINQMKNIMKNTATKTIWEQMQDRIMSNKIIKTNNVLNSFRSNMVNSIAEESNPVKKNENTVQDVGGLSKLVGLGVSTGIKQVPYYIENANENIYSNYKNMRTNQFLNNPKVNELEKGEVKAQNDFVLKSKGINVDNGEKIETNLVKKSIRDSINKDNQKIQEEQAKMSNAVTGKLGEIAPSMGQMIPGTVLSAVDPYLGTMYFTTSAGGGYIEDALNRGMDDKQAFTYGTIMGALEGASESIITGQQLSKVSKAFAGKEISKKVLESYGFNIFENAVQEAVIEPAQEITAGVVGDKADWSNMGSRMLESGFNGALMGAISNGVTYGLEKSGNVYNKIKNGENITETEYKEALQENIDKFGKDAVENAMKKGATEVYQEINNLQQQSTQNEPILPTQQINQEQNKVAQNENIKQILPTQNNIKEDNLKGKSFEDIVDDAMNNYEYEEVKSPLQNRDINTIGKDTKTNAYQYDNPKVKPYFQQMAEMIGEDIGNIASPDNRKTQKGGGTALNTNIPAIKQLKEMGYSYDQIVDGIVNIIDDHGKENNALSKKLEIIIDDQLRNGYTNSYGKYISPNQEYINLISKDNTQNNQVLPTDNKDNIKSQQFNIIKETNPMLDDYHTGIRSENDIKTFDEVINDDESFVYGDFSKEDAEKALKKGKVTVYSSKPIEQGSFVSTSKNMAKDYAGSGKIYSQEVNLNDVAWINGDEGQYAKVNNLVNNQNSIEKNQNTVSQKDILSSINNYENATNTTKRNDILNIARALNVYHKGETYIDQNISDKAGKNPNPKITEIDDFFKSFSDKEDLRKQAYSFALRKLINKKVNIKDINENIDMAQKGLKKTFNKNQDNVKMQSVNNLLNIVQEGLYLNSSKKSENIIYHYFYAPVLTSRGKEIAMITITEDLSNKNQSNKFYYHDLRQFSDLKKNLVQAMPHNNVRNMLFEQDSFINNSIPQNDNSVKNDTITNKYTQNSENNTQNVPTKGETINWTDYEKPNGKIRKHYRSIIESSNTTAEAKAIAKELMGTDTYVPESNKNLINKADARINNTTPEVELNSLMSRVTNNEKVSDVDIAVGERLIEYYSKIGDKEHLTDAIHTTALAGTQAGRTVQAMALLNHMTPQGQVVWLERNINKANIELQQKFKNKKDIPQFELTSEMTDKILNAEGKEEMFKALDEVYEELGEQVPKTKLEQIDEWRYFSMLANIKTHGRNMIGNVAMGLTQRAKNKVAGAIEGVVSKFNPEMERTHTIAPTSKAVKEFAKNDVKNMDVQTELGMNENKYNPQSRLQNARKTFKTDALNNTLGKMFDINSKLLEVEDNIGLKSMYVKALGEYITANKIDINNITDEQLAKARKHAIKESKEATFHQESALATALNQMGRKNNITKFMLDATVPFKKTPINVAKSGVQYSPAGLIKSAVYDSVQLRKGNITINQYIDNISKGLTGTGITFMGYVLAEAGILKASGGDDDKKEKYDEEQGKQSYSIEVGGKTYSLDWLSPVGIPLFIGAEINQQFHNTKREKNSKSNDDDKILNQVVKRVANISNATANAMNPMSEMSMVSGITSVLSSYNKENAVGDMLVNTGKSYINQFVPTAVGQLARTTDKYERTTKSTKSGTFEKAVDYTANQIKSKIPGLRQTLPVKTDIWGKEVKQNENLPFRAFNNFVNPSIIKDVSTDKVDKELNDLYAKTGESSIIPKSIENKYTINGTDYRMTNEEYAKYNKKYGETSYNLIKDFINSKGYKDLNNEQKQKAIENIYTYAKESGKVDYAKNNKLDIKESTLYETMDNLKKQGGKQSSYINYIANTTGLEKEKDKNEVLLNSNYDNKTKSIIYANGTGKDDKLYNNIKNSTININEYLDYKINESNDKFSADKDSDGKAISGSAKQKVYNYVNDNITGYKNKLLLLGQKYKLTQSEQQELAKYIYSISNNAEERNQVFEYFSKNFTVKDGKVYYK